MNPAPLLRCAHCGKPIRHGEDGHALWEAGPLIAVISPVHIANCEAAFKDSHSEKTFVTLPMSDVPTWQNYLRTRDDPEIASRTVPSANTGS